MLILDQQGVEEMEAAQQELLDRMAEVERESEERAAAGGEPTQPHKVGLYRRIDRLNMN